MMTSCFGFYSCYGLISTDLNPIIASAITGLLCSFLPLIPKLKISNIAAIGYNSRFAAIGVDQIISHSLYLIFIPLTLFVIFVVTADKFIGHGGKLGTIAFISTGLVMGVLSWF